MSAANYHSSFTSQKGGGISARVRAIGNILHQGTEKPPNALIVGESLQVQLGSLSLDGCEQGLSALRIMAGEEGYETTNYSGDEGQNGTSDTRGNEAFLSIEERINRAPAREIADAMREVSKAHEDVALAYYLHLPRLAIWSGVGRRYLSESARYKELAQTLVSSSTGKQSE